VLLVLQEVLEELVELVLQEQLALKEAQVVLAVSDLQELLVLQEVLEELVA
jgi:hypothetical protein